MFCKIDLIINVLFDLVIYINAFELYSTYYKLGFYTKYRESISLIFYYFIKKGYLKNMISKSSIVIVGYLRY